MMFLLVMSVFASMPPDYSDEGPSDPPPPQESFFQFNKVVNNEHCKKIILKVGDQGTNLLYCDTILMANYSYVVGIAQDKEAVEIENVSEALLMGDIPQLDKRIEFTKKNIVNIQSIENRDLHMPPKVVDRLERKNDGFDTFFELDDNVSISFRVLTKFNIIESFEDVVVIIKINYIDETYGFKPVLPTEYERYGNYFVYKCSAINCDVNNDIGKYKKGMIK